VADQHRQRQVGSAKSKEGRGQQANGVGRRLLPRGGGTAVGSHGKLTDQERCKKLFPFSGDARLAAGAPASDDVFKCALKPLDPADYKTPPSAEQMARLRQVFPDGVCDYAKPGVEQAPLAGTWASFKGDGEFVALEPGR
jgi:hypothetical protein